MISEKIQLIEINAQIPRKNSLLTLNKDSKDKNMISEIALVFCVFLNYKKLAKNFIHIVTEKRTAWEGISKIIQIGYSADSDNVILEYITNKTKWQKLQRRVSSKHQSNVSRHLSSNVQVMTLLCSLIV